jgi:hypothetical protein
MLAEHEVVAILWDAPQGPNAIDLTLHLRHELDTPVQTP